MMYIEYLQLGNILAMFFSLIIFGYGLMLFRIVSKELFYFMLPFALFALLHGVYHVFSFLKYEELAEFMELSSVVMLLIVSLQFLREKI